MNDYSKQHTDRVKQETRSCVNKGLEKHCHKAGCTYNSTGKCRVHKKGRCPYAAGAKELADKKKLFKNNKFAVQMFNRFKMNEEVRSSVGEVE